MLKNFKIRTQIGVGFVLVLLVSALMIVFALEGLRTGSESFKTYRELARASVLSGRVQANMLSASNAAKSFLSTREDDQLEVFQERFDRARDFALEQQTNIADPTRRELSRELVEDLNNYRAASEEVFGLMRRRDDVLRQTLNPQGKRMRENLTQIMVSAFQDNDSEAAYVAGRALERVLLGRLYMLKFLEDNRDADVNRVEAELGPGFEQAFAEMNRAIENPTRRERLKDFDAARSIYLGAFEEIVNTIKTRNTIIKQRMQPLERSVAEVSEQIKLSLKADQDELGPRVQESNDRTFWAVLIGSLIAIMLAIAIALSIIRSITRPIDEFVETVGNIQESGDLSKRLAIRGTEELGVMARTLNDFLASIESRAEVAANVGRGILDTPIELRSKQDTLGIALQRMTGKLRDNADDATLRNWFSKGQGSVHDASRGALEEAELGQRLTHALSVHLEAQLGSLYVCRKDSNRLQCIGEYAAGGRACSPRILWSARDSSARWRGIASLCWSIRFRRVTSRFDPPWGRPPRVALSYSHCSRRTGSLALSS